MKTIFRYRPEFFSGVIFTTAQVVFMTAKIAFIFTSLSADQIYDFHIFTVVYLNIVENLFGSSKILSFYVPITAT